MEEYFEKKDEKQIREGKLKVKITTYYMSKHPAGLRIEVRKVSNKKRTTVEVELLIGDDILVLKKSYKHEVLIDPKKKDIDSLIDEMVLYAKELRLFEID